METHYVCTGGCGGVSGTPGNCHTGGCPDYGKPLKECHCENGMHSEAGEQERDGTDKESTV